MKARKSFAVVVVSAALLISSSAQAGSIEYLSNLSADYIRTFSRNAATDGVDAAVYNPAGAAWLDGDGLYFGLTTQSLFGEYAIEDDGVKYPADIMVPVVPSLHLAWKKGDLAVVGAFTVPAGGGSLVYEKGVPYLVPLAAFVADSNGNAKTGTPPTNGEFSGSTIFYGATFGVAYRYSIASLSLGGRLVLANKKIGGSATYGDVTAELDAEKSATGFGGIIGLHLRPSKEINIGLRYELETPLEFETTSTASGMVSMDKWQGKALQSFADGAKEKRPLPATLGMGISVGPFSGLTISSSAHYYFIKDADEGEDNKGAPGNGLGAYVSSYDDDYDNGWDLSAAIEYQVNEELVVSAGYIHTVIGGNKETYGDFEYAPDSDSVGGGARYLAMKDLYLTLGFSRTFYEEVSNDPIDAPGLEALLSPNGETFTKRVYDLSLGAQYKF